MSSTDTQDLRNQYAAWRQGALDYGFTGNFKEAASMVLVSKGIIPADATPEQWVDAAEHVCWSTYADAKAEEYDDYDAEGPGITEPWEVAYGPRDYDPYF